MSLPTASVTLHKLSDLDVKCIRKILRVEGRLRETSTAAVTTSSAATPLSFAVMQLGLSDARRDLLSCDSARAAKGNTALHVAFLKYGPGFIFDSLLKVYLEETNRNMTNASGLSFLHMACTRPYLHAVQAILRDGRVNVNCRVSLQRSGSVFAGYSPLHFATRYGQHQVAELLIQHDADLYAQDHNGSTPLHLALEQRDVRMIDLLLAHDRRRENLVDNWGLSHLMVACAGNDELAVREYLQQGGVDSVDAMVNVGHVFAGYTALQFAQEFGRRNTVRLLNASGAGIGDRTPPPPIVASIRRVASSFRLPCLCTWLNVLALAMFLLLLLPTLLPDSYWSASFFLDHSFSFDGVVHGVNALVAFVLVMLF